jgi:hypothetical protein
MSTELLACTRDEISTGDLQDLQKIAISTHNKSKIFFWVHDRFDLNIYWDCLILL